MVRSTAFHVLRVAGLLAAVAVTSILGGVSGGQNRSEAAGGTEHLLARAQAPGAHAQCVLQQVEPDGPFYTSTRDATTSPDGRFVAVARGLGTAGEVKSVAFDAASGSWGGEVNSVLPGSTPRHLAFSPNGAYLAVSLSSSPFIRVYEFDQVTGNIGPAVPDPGVLPSSSSSGVAFSNAGNFIAVSTGSWPYVHVYQWFGWFGTNFLNPDLPPNIQDGQVPQWSPNDDAIVLTHTWSSSSTPQQGATAWAWSGAGFGSRYPASLSAGELYFGVDFSPTGTHIAFSNDGFNSQEIAYVYEWNSATGFGAKLAHPPDEPPTTTGSTTTRVSWSPDGSRLAIPFFGDDFAAVIETWELDAGVFTASCSIPATTFDSTLTVDWHPSGDYLIAAGGRQSDGSTRETDLRAFQVGAPPPEPGSARVIYVHGITANYRAPSFGELWSSLDGEFGAGTVRLFEYYQDVGSVESGVCLPRAPEIPTAGHPMEPLYQAWSVDPTICDSQSDVALNAMLLYAELVDVYANNGQQPLIIVSNSMGAAVTRGALALGESLASPTYPTDAMVDSTLFIHGAQDGSFWVPVIRDNEDIVEDIRIVTDFFNVADEWDLTRPALDQLGPQSDWYGWVNPDATHLPTNVAVYNVYSDIAMFDLDCWVWFFHCEKVDLGYELGDGIMAEGTDDPFDLPVGGGARLLAGAPSAENWQWRLEDEVYWPRSEPAGVLVAGLDFKNSEINHINIGQNLAAITTDDCASGHAAVQLDEALLNVLRGRVTGLHYACQP